MQTTSLLLGIHCHQPVDNFDRVLYETIEKSYRPFFEVLKNFPDFKVSVHYSGWLLEFIEKNDQKLFELMKSLSDQLEFFSGGYYEPVLASIPSKDRIAQITKLNEYIEKHFNQTPKGLWLTERVWDNSIIGDLKKCGIEYVIVDDYHFISNGYDPSNLNGYFITEEGGEQIGLFPISQALRYAIPFYNQNKTNDILHTFANVEGRNAAIIFDDGEKFGVWPKTYETVYEKKWLEKFLERSLKDKKIKVQTYSEFFKANKPISLAYLSTTSYQEMGEWSVSADDSLKIEELIHNNPGVSQYVKGGIWKNFFSKYQESNWIHKRVLELSKKQMESKTYKDALYRAECNDVLWHGVFGGIYLPNLRDNAYKYILKCENILNNSFEVLDIDCDGYEEYKYNKGSLLTIISPKQGGQIFELDIKDKAFNLQNTLTRYKEAYHSKIEVSEEEPETEEIDISTIDIENDDIETIHSNTLYVDEEVPLNYDWYLKKSSVDHISNDSFTIENFEETKFWEYGDFANQPYEVVKSDEKSLKLVREGGVHKEIKHDTKITKKYKFKKKQINLELKVETKDKAALKYINEWNLHFMDIKQLSFNKQQLDDNIVLNTSKLVIEDFELNKALIFEFDNIIEIYICKTNSISQSEKGVDFTLQGISFAFIFELLDELDEKISFKVEDL